MFEYFTEKACGNSVRRRYYLHCMTRMSRCFLWFATLSPLAIDRSISRRVHALRIAIAHTRMYGMRACRHTCAHAYTRMCMRERSRKDEEHEFRAHTYTCISVFPRCYANERASRSSKTAILGRTSSSLRQRFDRTEIEDASLEGKRDSLSLYKLYIKIQQLVHLSSPWQKSLSPLEILFGKSKELV